MTKSESPLNEEFLACGVCNGKGFINVEHDLEICVSCNGLGTQFKFSEQPPIGVMPRHLLDEKRYAELGGAITRYLENHKLIPPEWLEEFMELNEKLLRRKMAE